MANFYEQRIERLESENLDMRGEILRLKNEIITLKKYAQEKMRHFNELAIITAKMDILLDKRSKRLTIQHQNDTTCQPPAAEPPKIISQTVKNDYQEEKYSVHSDTVETVERQERIPIEISAQIPDEQNNQPISPESQHDTSTEVETIEIQDEEIQEITIKSENLSDELPQENQEVTHHKAGPIREEGPDYIIYRPERKIFEKTDSGQFQCSDCSYTNIKYSLVMRHSLTHTTNSQRPYQCKKCEYGSATRDLLFVHLKKFHRSKPKSLVRREGKDFIIFHQVSLPKTHQDENGYFSCHICDFKTLHNSAIIRHAMTHTGEKPYQCKLCSYGSVTIDQLRRHLKGRHGSELPLTQRENKDEVTRMRPEDEHASAVKNDTEEKSIDGIKVRREGIHFRILHSEKIEFAKNEKGQHQCPVCNYSHVHYRTVRRHYMIHTGEKPYHCKQCNYRSVTIDQLKKHLRKNHHVEMPSTFLKVQNWDELQTEENPEVKFEITDEDVIDLEHIDSSSSAPNESRIHGHPFSGCDNVRREGKNFIILHSQKHNFDQNDVDKKFECPQCDYRHVQYFKVQRHFMTHTGERPYICKICTYDSITLESLKNHLKKNHQVELPAEHSYEPRTAQEYKTYQCDKCPRVFNNILECKSHLKTHQTATKSRLFSEELTSNEHGFFPCPEENCEFKPAESEIILKKHMRREHYVIFPTDVKPDDPMESYTYLLEDLPKKVDGWLKCPECDFKTVHAIWHLKRHMTNVHQSVIIGDGPRIQARKRRAEQIANSLHVDDTVYESHLSENTNNSSNVSPIRTRKRTSDMTTDETIQPIQKTQNSPLDFVIDL